MPIQLPKVGQVVTAVRDVFLAKNVHIAVLSSAAPTVLRKGSEAQITAITPTHIEINCKDGTGQGPQAWGLRVKVAKAIWGISFQ